MSQKKITSADINASGSPSSSTFLRGDNSWQTISTGLTVGTTAIASGTAGRILYENGSNVLGEDSDLSFNGTDLLITSTYIGNGTSSATPANGNIHGTDGVGTNIVGGNLIYTSGISTGNANRSAHVWKITAQGSTGTTPQTTYTGMTLDDDSGKGALKFDDVVSGQQTWIRGDQIYTNAIQSYNGGAINILGGAKGGGLQGLTSTPDADIYTSVRFGIGGASGLQSYGTAYQGQIPTSLTDGLAGGTYYAMAFTPFFTGHTVDFTTLHFRNEFDLTNLTAGTGRDIWIKPILTSLSTGGYIGIEVDVGSTANVGFKQTGANATNVFAGIFAAKALTGTAVAFASLPGAPTAGMMVTVTDSNTNTWGATIAGGGANTVLAFYNGANWTVAAK